ncbi:MAG: hypothetical protein IKK39_09700, partial [Thermoguttaceae bacterium]|nr:hypothetical protein [Thermoguttaceae bacterium]
GSAFAESGLPAFRRASSAVWFGADGAINFVCGSVLKAVEQTGRRLPATLCPNRRAHRLGGRGPRFALTARRRLFRLVRRAI